MVWFQTEPLFAIYGAIGGVAVFYGLCSSILKRYLFISEIVVSLSAGIILGGFPSNLYSYVEVDEWFQDVTRERVLEEVARLGIAIQLMATALRVYHKGRWPYWKSLFVLLLPVMTLSWLSSGLLAWGLLKGFNIWEGLLVGSFAAPTDPVIAASIITGTFATQKVTYGIRTIISTESGVNDGLAYPFVLLPIVFITRSPGDALLHWFLVVILYEVGVALIAGALIGLLIGWLLRWSEKLQMIDKPSLLGFSLALSLLVLGVLQILRTDAILAVFTAGLGFAHTLPIAERFTEESIQETVDTLFTTTTFVLLGVGIPWNGWGELGWRGPVLSLLVLVFKRVPFVLLFAWFLRPPVEAISEALYLGWFGPMGVAAVFYGALASRLTEEDSDNSELFFPIATQFMVFSVIIHGTTAGPLTYLLAWIHPPAADADQQRRKKELEAEEEEEEGIPPRNIGSKSPPPSPSPSSDDDHSPRGGIRARDTRRSHVEERSDENDKEEEKEKQKEADKREEEEKERARKPTEADAGDEPEIETG
ncbi:Sodium/hydrogen exchanger [Balamuthia mandrillaris]